MKNDLIKKLTDYIKKPKILLIIGFIGIGLIFISSLLPKKAKTVNAGADYISTEKYKEEITESVKRIVTSVTGDKNPTVVVTLESGVRYTYADSGETDNTTTNGASTNQESKSTKRSYITVKDSDGGEKALIITENMPEVRGVAVICDGGYDEENAQNIKNAVTAALNISSKRVFISGGTAR